MLCDKYTKIPLFFALCVLHSTPLITFVVISFLVFFFFALVFTNKYDRPLNKQKSEKYESLWSKSFCFCLKWMEKFSQKLLRWIKMIIFILKPIQMCWVKQFDEESSPKRKKKNDYEEFHRKKCKFSLHQLNGKEMETKVHGISTNKLFMRNEIAYFEP